MQESKNQQTPSETATPTNGDEKGAKSSDYNNNNNNNKTTRRQWRQSKSSRRKKIFVGCFDSHFRNNRVDNCFYNCDEHVRNSIQPGRRQDKDKRISSSSSLDVNKTTIGNRTQRLNSHLCLFFSPVDCSLV
jgi:hypothetical protein